ncbi:hypothetical protein BH09PLA1_BH09PLA1_21490 [soil metagenome]
MNEQHTNRLARETSPYLLQHAHNPVDWYAWGPEAFDAARSQDKPIFLSVGYSTCYWCHVMERQCFENEAIAKEMNERFINIKVDREERPDVDQLYMTAVQVLTRQGGWPMSVFLLPDLRPFYGGTYFPPVDSHGRPGFPTLLRALDDAYHNRRKDVEQSAAQLKNILEQLAEPAPPEQAMHIDQKFIDELIDRSTSDYEPIHGGFGGAPKFPRQTLIQMLLVHHANQPDAKLAKMLPHTLDAMANGGIRDHLGGAFHRYSTDAKWLVPHFDIMLYDNAMLAWIYVEAFRQFGDERYAQIARDIFWFVNEEMTSPDGAFYTALDAEVDAEEGGSYLWTAEQVRDVLGPDDGKIFNRIYGLDGGPNFADPHGKSEVPDKNVLYLANQPSDDTPIRAMRSKLYAARRKRKQPLLDTKIITSWNALMIRALAYAGKVLKHSSYSDSATRAATFLMQRHRRDDGSLYRTSRDGVAKHDAFLDDYAALAQAQLELGDRDAASSLIKTMREKFAAPNGGFFFTAAGADDLIVRQMVATDSPLPSGNAIAAAICRQVDQADVSLRTFQAFAGQMQQNGESMSALVEAAESYVRSHGAIDVAAQAPADAAAKKQSGIERPKKPAERAAQVVALAARWEDAKTLLVAVKIQKGFHINANETTGDLIPTRLQIDRDAAVEYPDGVMKQFPFSDKPVAIYSGEIVVRVRFEEPPKFDPPLHVALTYQACDDSACLPPVTKQFELNQK